MATGDLHRCQDCAEVKAIVLDMRNGLFGDPGDRDKPGMVGRIAALEADVQNMQAAHGGFKDWARLIVGIVGGAIAGHYTGHQGGPPSP